MIKLQNAQATQKTDSSGGKTDWVIELNGEELYRLPAHCSVQDTFRIRESIEKLLQRSFEDGIEQQKALAKITLDRVVENGNAQLDALKEENLRLAAILESMINDEVA